MRFFRKIFKFTFKSLDFIGKYGIIILLGWILTNAAIFHTKYVYIYADAQAAMEREVDAARFASYLEAQKAQHEHDRQVIVARMIQSQEDWILQANIMREAWLEEKAKRVQAKRDFYLTAREMYHLIRMLEYYYPEVYDEIVPDVMKNLPKELKDALNKKFPGDQILPCLPKLEQTL